jgi:peptide/nickel transport system permease protein
MGSFGIRYPTDDKDCKQPPDLRTAGGSVRAMLRLAIRRMCVMVPTALVVTALLFFAVNGLLGSPAAMMLGQDASPQTIAELDAEYGFDQPLAVQYMRWLGEALRGDLGRSYTTRQSVAQAVGNSLPVTIELAVWSILLATSLAIVLNTIPTARLLTTRTTAAVNVVGITVPNFMLGISLIFLFSVKLGWLPTTGWAPWSDGAIDHLRHIIMPVVTLSSYYFGVFSIVYRAELHAVTRRMFIRVAQAKGLGEWRVAFRHAMPNAILPVITFVGISAGQLTGGAVVTETIFSMPGIGRLFVRSIETHDFPTMLAVGMLIVVSVVLMNLLADIAYTIANPQIRFDP